jgi:hypothetical protein
MTYEPSRRAGRANLTLHRKQESVWDRRGWDGTDERATATRVLAGIGGGILALEGLRRRGWVGHLFFSVGASLAWWAVAGEGKVEQAQHWVGEIAERAGLRQEPDVVHEASDESFPASDAPSWSPTVGTAVHRTSH